MEGERRSIPGEAYVVVGDDDDDDDILRANGPLEVGHHDVDH